VVSLCSDLLSEVVDRRMVRNVEVAVGDHGASPVPAATADDVYATNVERVGRTHHRANVEVVFPVLDRNLQDMAPGLKIGNDGTDGPVAIAIENIAPVTLFEELGVKPWVVRPGLRIRSYTRRSGCPG
jgi:hypothetical protein